MVDPHAVVFGEARLKGPVDGAPFFDIALVSDAVVDLDGGVAHENGGPFRRHSGKLR
ncbi:MAG: hypothetical protein AAGJ53_08450 [Pseudomonadota bacterium]